MLKEIIKKMINWVNVEMPLLRNFGQIFKEIIIIMESSLVHILILSVFTHLTTGRINSM